MAMTNELKKIKEKENRKSEITPRLEGELMGAGRSKQALNLHFYYYFDLGLF
jgi:hypothetical protein